MFYAEMKSNTLANSYTYCRVCPCIFSWSITHSLTYFEKTHTYLTLGFRTIETRMYCTDIVQMSKREREQAKRANKNDV